MVWNDDSFVHVMDRNTILQCPMKRSAHPDVAHSVLILRNTIGDNSRPNNMSKYHNLASMLSFGTFHNIVALQLRRPRERHHRDAVAHIHWRLDKTVHYAIEMIMLVLRHN